MYLALTAIVAYHPMPPAIMPPAVPPPGYIGKLPEPPLIRRTTLRKRTMPPGWVPVPMSVSKQTYIGRINVVLNGRRYLFAIDTGADGTIVDTPVAKELGLKVEATPFTSIDMSNSAPKPIRAAVCDAVQIGSVRLFGLILAVTDMDKTGSVWGDHRYGPVYGILGANVLSQFDAIIDTEDQTLWLADDRGYHHHLLQGRWRAVRVENNGRASNDCYRANTYEMTVDGNAVRFSWPEVIDGHRVTKTRSGELRIETLLRPRRILQVDVQIDDKPVDPQRSCRGIFEFIDGRLRVAMPITDPSIGTSFPTTFTSTPTNGIAVFTFERVRPDPWPIAFPLVRLLWAFLPPSGPLRLGGWGYTFTAAETLTAEKADGSLRIDYHLDGSATVRPAPGHSFDIRPRPGK